MLTFRPPPTWLLITGCSLALSGDIVWQDSAALRPPAWPTGVNDEVPHIMLTSDRPVVVTAAGPAVPGGSGPQITWQMVIYNGTRERLRYTAQSFGSGATTDRATTVLVHPTTDVNCREDTSPTPGGADLSPEEVLSLPPGTAQLFCVRVQPDTAAHNLVIVSPANIKVRFTPQPS